LLGLSADQLSFARENGLQVSMDRDIVSGKLFSGRNRGRCVQVFENKLVLPSYGGKENPHKASVLKAAFATLTSQQGAQGSYV
jgi:hypothetical protein